MTARILIHYMINGGFLGAGGEANRDNNYILDHIDRLKEIPVHIVHGVTIGCAIYTRRKPSCGLCAPLATMR
jgi:hypothetical protein